MNEENNKKITTHLSSDHFWIEEAKKDAILVEEAKTKGQNAKAKKASSKGSRIKKTDQKVDQEETKDNHRCEAESTSSNSTQDLSSAVELSSDCFKYDITIRTFVIDIVNWKTRGKPRLPLLAVKRRKML